MFKSLKEALQALAEVGVTADGTHHIAVCEEFWEREGPEFFRDIVQDIRHRRELAVTCFPDLLTYAAASRVNRPVRGWDSLTDAELEQIRLMTESFREVRSREGAFQPQATRPLVITTTPAGLVALSSFVPVLSPSAVMLLDDEFDAWIASIGEDKRTDPWWYEKWWFRVDREPQDGRLKDRYHIEDTAALRSGGEVWELSFGTRSGALAAVAHEQLFVWDGTTAVSTEFESFWVA
jgi:hypothetical protein